MADSILETIFTAELGKILEVVHHDNLAVTPPLFFPSKSKTGLILYLLRLFGCYRNQDSACARASLSLTTTSTALVFFVFGL